MHKLRDLSGLQPNTQQAIVSLTCSDHICRKVEWPCDVTGRPDIALTLPTPYPVILVLRLGMTSLLGVHCAWQYLSCDDSSGLRHGSYCSLAVVLLGVCCCCVSYVACMCVGYGVAHVRPRHGDNEFRGFQKGCCHVIAGFANLATRSGAKQCRANSNTITPIVNFGTYDVYCCA